MRSESVAYSFQVLVYLASVLVLSDAHADQGGIPTQVRALQDEVRVLQDQVHELMESTANSAHVTPAHVVDSNGMIVGPWLSGSGVALYRTDPDLATLRLVRQPCDPCLPTGKLVPYLGASREGLFFAGDQCTGAMYSEVSDAAIAFGPVFVTPAVYDPLTEAQLYPPRTVRLVTVGSAATVAYRSRSYDFGACSPENGYRSEVYPVEVVADFPFVPPFFIK